MATQGYIPGETLGLFDGSRNSVVISTRHSAIEWKNCEKNPEWKEIQSKIEKRIARPATMKIYVHA